MAIKIIDNRHSLIEKCREAGFDALQGDYFEEAVKIPHHVLCTASNPHFTFGGGIDAAFIRHFPFYCAEKQKRITTNSGNERIGNIIFAISVDFRLQSNEELVREALIFARDHTLAHETLCLCGIGTMIGGLQEEKLLELLIEVFNPLATD